MIARARAPQSFAAVQQDTLDNKYLCWQARAQLRAALPAEVFRVAGVSFEGRQALVAALQPGVPIVLPSGHGTGFEAVILPSAANCDTIGQATCKALSTPVCAREPAGAPLPCFATPMRCVKVLLPGDRPGACAGEGAGQRV